MNFTDSFSLPFTPARENPFAVNRVKDFDFRFPEGNWEENLARLERMSFRGAIVGPHGSGKSTLLRRLARRLEDEVGSRSFAVRVPHDRAEHAHVVSRVLDSVDRGLVILLDSAEKLSLRRWTQVICRTRGAAGLIVAVHRKCILPTWVRTQTSLQLLRSLVDEMGLSEHSQIASALPRVFEQNGGNIREALRELYDEFASGRLRPIASVARPLTGGSTIATTQCAGTSLVPLRR